MLVMVVFFIAFRWIHLSTPLIRLFLLVLILLLMPTLNFLPVWFALSLLRFRLPSRPRGVLTAAAANPANPPPPMPIRGDDEFAGFGIVGSSTHEKGAAGQPQLLR